LPEQRDSSILRPQEECRLKSPRALSIAMCFVIALFPLIGACTSGSTASPDVSVVVGGAAIPSGGVDFGTCSRSGYLYSAYADKTVTVKNLGTADLAMSGSVVISATGSNAGELAVLETLPASITIPSGSQYEFTIRFDPSWGPTYYDGQERRETVTVASDDPDEGSYSFQIFGVGTC
jgi:hypothetical protein